jgi:nucleoside phosphorylase
MLIGIIGAMQEEIKLLSESMKIKETYRKSGYMIVNYHRDTRNSACRDIIGY